MFLLIPLKFGKSQFLADLVIANAQLLNLFVCHMCFFTSFKIDAVDDAVRVDMLAVDMRTNQNLAALEVSSQSACCFVRHARVDVCTFWKTLYHVVKHHAAILAVQQLRTQEFIERCFRLTANAADELLSIPEGFARLRHISHDTFHAAACLCAFLVVYEMDDCDFGAPPSCISRRAVLILANSCTAESRFAN